MFGISRETISDGCSPSTYQKGLSYLRNGRVKRLLYVPREDKYIATVKGSYNYTVEILTDIEGRLKNYSCTCPAFNKYYGYCKHLVAAMLALESNEKLRAERAMLQARQSAAEILDSFHSEDYVRSREVVLKPTLIFHAGSAAGRDNSAAVSLCAGEEKLYVVKNLKRFLEHIASKESMEFGKRFTFDPRMHVFNEQDGQMISLFQGILEIFQMSQNNYSYSRWDNGPFSGKEIRLPELLFKKWLAIMDGQTFPAVINDVPWGEVSIINQDLPIDFLLEEKDRQLSLQAAAFKTMIPLSKDGEYFFYQGLIYHISPKQRQNLMPLYKGLVSAPDHSLTFLAEHKERLVQELLPRIKKAGKLAIDKGLAEKIEERPLRAEIYLDTDGDLITTQIKFIYGDRVINPFAGEGDAHPDSGRIILRDGERERRILTFFEDSGFHVLGEQVYLEDEEQIFRFVQETVPALQKEGEVFFSESFRKIGQRPAPSLKGGVSINGELDLLELDFELEGIDREELFDVFLALKEKKKYYRLKDGAFLPLVSEELENMAGFLDGLDLKKDDFNRGPLRIPKYRAIYLDSFMHRDRLGRFKRDRAFKELVQNIREPEDTDFILPPQLEPVLRDYQKTGFKWLKTLASYGFGGILADDMGLGKTLEAISFLQSDVKPIKQGDGSGVWNQKDAAAASKYQDSSAVGLAQEAVHHPALVIAPTSVIFNWQAEIAKFAPEMTTLVVSGSKSERSDLIGQAKNFDVVVTSYPLIRKDIASYQETEFSSCILDEAQYIKNPHSLTARTVKMIPARNRFALTGTPIENSLVELWSIFDFLMPGYLPSYQKFTQKYITPLKKGDGKEALEELSRKIDPFVLRRVKKDVLRELPEKIELKMVSELTRDQKKVYLAYLEKIRGEIAGAIAENGFEKSRIKILAGLTRLRQICCHPSLFLENYHGESGKLAQLEEVLADLKAGGHRSLLFSQFTSMLAIIRRLLDQEKYRYFYLDGSVETKERLAMADAFNQGEGDLFLISLKAGGTGLNLTGADTVIHFDPWWNPAVEDQAADRAHRIGQDKVVNVLKFISLGTIEEKIFELQQKKRELIRQVITPGETFISQMDEKELRELLEV